MWTVAKLQVSISKLIYCIFFIMEVYLLNILLIFSSKNIPTFLKIEKYFLNFPKPNNFIFLKISRIILFFHRLNADPAHNPYFPKKKLEPLHEAGYVHH